MEADRKVSLTASHRSLPLLIFKSLRPEQWTKNLLVFAALVFSKNLFDLLLFMKILGAFGLFCLLSGSVYLVNDIWDKEEDQRHPLKRHRPIASGKLASGPAWTAALLLSLLSLAASFLLDPLFGLTAAGYLALNLAYTRFLKHVVILDVMTLAASYALRALAGGPAIGVPISSWLLISTILLALFVGLGKRRHELIFLEEATRHRPILSEYSPYLLDQMISIVTASTVVVYALYTTFIPYLSLTVPFVLYGIFRYLYLVHQKEQGGNPTRMLLTDLPLLVNVGLWLATVVVILYLPLENSLQEGYK